MIELSAVNQERLFEFNRTVARWTRLSGTAEEREAAEHVAHQLQEAGLAVQTLTHDAYISLPGQATLRITKPTDQGIHCITHSMGIPTDPGGVTAELVYAGRGTAEEYARAGAAGKVALVEGRATPAHAANATRAGVRGLVCISARQALEMCCSPIWGNPAASTVAQLPKVHLLSVRQQDGEALRELCRQGTVEVHFTAQVETGWTKTPIVVADLAPGHPDAERDKFVLFSGHLDSWYVGAMDNGSANAAMLELANIFAAQRGTLRRGLRLAMWSGHSHGRYSSSAWYADNHWFDLADNCVAHINIDSIGAIDADAYSTNSMPQTIGLGEWAVAQVANGKLEGKRVGRNSDQSFLGIGIPSLLGSVSRQADGTLGWWWHNEHDSLDKIDPVRLARDTRIFLRVLERLLTEPVLPLDYAASAEDLRQQLSAIAERAGAAFDLSPAVAGASRLEALCRKLQGAATRVQGGEAAGAINSCLQDLGRILIPATYTGAGRFAHDPALETPFLPRLRAAGRLLDLPPDSDDAKFLQVDVVRARNEVTDALRRACTRIEACLERIA